MTQLPSCCRTLFCILLLTPSFAAVSATEPMLEKSILFEEQSNGFYGHRIPGIIVTAKGTVLAYCEARKFSNGDHGEIEIHLRRSVDGGRTFGEPTQIAHLGPRLPRNPYFLKREAGKDGGNPNEQTVNNPMAIADRDGTVHLVYCVEYLRCFYIRSEDDGVTWSKPVEISSVLEGLRDQVDWQAIATGPGHGIQLKGGRLVVPVWFSDYRKNNSLRKGAATLFSDDGGSTWQCGEIAMAGGNEANVAELSDGRVMLTARNGDPRQRRLVVFSPDGRSDWSTPRIADELLEPGCMAGVTTHPGSPALRGPLLLFSNANTTDRDHAARRNLTIHASTDDGATWPVKRILESGPSAYSDLATLPDGTILCFYESGTETPKIKRNRDWAYANITLARFNLDWLLDGAE